MNDDATTEVSSRKDFSEEEWVRSYRDTLDRLRGNRIKDESRVHEPIADTPLNAIRVTQDALASLRVRFAEDKDVNMRRWRLGSNMSDITTILLHRIPELRNQPHNDMLEQFTLGLLLESEQLQNTALLNQPPGSHPTYWDLKH